MLEAGKNTTCDFGAGDLLPANIRCQDAKPMSRASAMVTHRGIVPKFAK